MQLVSSRRIFEKLEINWAIYLRRILMRCMSKESITRGHLSLLTSRNNLVCMLCYTWGCPNSLIRKYLPFLGFRPSRQFMWVTIAIFTQVGSSSDNFLWECSLSLIYQGLAIFYCYQNGSYNFIWSHLARRIRWTRFRKYLTFKCFQIRRNVVVFKVLSYYCPSKYNAFCFLFSNIAWRNAWASFRKCLRQCAWSISILEN